MRVIGRLMVIGLAAVSLVLVGAGSAHAAAATQQFGAATCSGGAISPGTYTSLKVTGTCIIPNGATVVVQQDLRITDHAVLDAATQAPTLTVHGNVFVGHQAVFALGCSAAFSPPCPAGVTTKDRIDGSVWADEPLGLLFHSNIIHGSLTMEGGGNGVNCVPNPIFSGPPYTTFEDDRIDGNVSISGYRSCWFGFIRNRDFGTVRVNDNRFFLADADEIVTNTISGNLVCRDNTPAPHIGDSGGTRNKVFGAKIAQCRAV